MDISFFPIYLFTSYFSFICCCDSIISAHISWKYECLPSLFLCCQAMLLLAAARLLSLHLWLQNARQNRYETKEKKQKKLIQPRIQMFAVRRTASKQAPVKPHRSQESVKTMHWWITTYTVRWDLIWHHFSLTYCAPFSITLSSPLAFARGAGICRW